MKYDKYKSELEAVGYKVEGGQVYDHMGNMCAGEDRFGQAWSKDVNLNEIVKKIDSTPKKVAPKKPAAKKAPAKKKAAE